MELVTYMIEQGSTGFEEPLSESLPEIFSSRVLEIFDRKGKVAEITGTSCINLK